MRADNDKRIDSGKDRRLPGAALRQPRHTQARVRRDENGVAALERAVFARGDFAKPGAQGAHGGMKKGIGRGIVRAQPHAVAKDEKDVHRALL